METVDTGLRHRPRVAGDREEEILDAAVAVLAEMGYDRLTMDAVAAAAKASKATLYRRWSSKADLVVDAVSRAKGCPMPNDVDTGSLRGDLLAMACGNGGFTEQLPLSVLAGLLTALHHDPDLHRAVLERFVGPRAALVDGVFARAVARGEIPPDVDVDLLARVLPAQIVFHGFILGIEPDDDLIVRVIDSIILPAARGSQDA